jgi:hypothetical protein
MITLVCVSQEMPISDYKQAINNLKSEKRLPFQAAKSQYNE